MGVGTVLAGLFVAAWVGGVTYMIASSGSSTPPQRQTIPPVIHVPTAPPQIFIPQTLPRTRPTSSTPTTTRSTPTSTWSTATTSPPVDRNLPPLVTLQYNATFSDPILILSHAPRAMGTPREVGGYSYNVPTDVPSGRFVYEILVHLGSCYLAGEHKAKKYKTIPSFDNSINVPVVVEGTSSLLTVITSYQTGLFSRHSDVGRFLNDLVKRGYDIYIRWASYEDLTDIGRAQIREIKTNFDNQIVSGNVNRNLDIVLNSLEKETSKVKYASDEIENSSQHKKIPGNVLNTSWNNTWQAGQVTLHASTGDNYEVALAIMFECSDSFRPPRGEMANTITMNLFKRLNDDF